MKVNNIANLIEEPTSIQQLRKKKNDRVKKVSNLDLNIFDRTRSKELLEIYHQQNHKPSIFNWVLKRILIFFQFFILLSTIFYSIIFIEKEIKKGNVKIR